MKKVLKIVSNSFQSINFRPKIGSNFINEAVILAGFVMVFAGLWGYDWRLACIICGIWLMIPSKKRAK